MKIVHPTSNNNNNVKNTFQSENGKTIFDKSGNSN